VCAAGVATANSTTQSQTILAQQIINGNVYSADSNNVWMRYKQNALDNKSKLVLAPEHEEPMGSWSSDKIRQSVSESVMLTWAPGKAK
jgi:hypothetical protein